MAANSPNLPKTLMPVIGTHGCLGHLLNTAKGWKAYDANDKALGTFPDQPAALSAVLILADGEANEADHANISVSKPRGVYEGGCTTLIMSHKSSLVAESQPGPSAVAARWWVTQSANSMLLASTIAMLRASSAFLATLSSFIWSIQKKRGR
jgi:hypothetical protein